MKRGVSDIIAVVLMIAVAIAIGVFVTNFATKWVTEQTGEESMTCAIKTNYVIDDAKFNYSGKNNMLVTITNKGDEGLYGFGFVLNNITNIRTFNSSDPRILNQLTVTSALGREQSHILTLNLTNSTHLQLGKSATEIKITNDACVAVSAAITSLTVY